MTELAPETAMQDNTEPMAPDGAPSQDSSATGAQSAAAPERAMWLAERERLEEQLRRALADLQNVRKRQLKELEDVRRRALDGIAAELLPVLDNFERAILSGDAGATIAASPLVAGVRMVHDLLCGVLARHGLTEIRAEGAPFDPSLHEGFGTEPSNRVPPGHVISVVQKGYVFAGHVLRPAKVVISQPAQPADVEPAIE